MNRTYEMDPREVLEAIAEVVRRKFPDHEGVITVQFFLRPRLFRSPEVLARITLKE